MLDFHAGPHKLTRPSAEGYDRIRLEPVTPHIGARVSGIRLAGPLTDDDLAEVRRALLDWKVLFFHEPDLDKPSHRAFAERWGALERHPFYEFVQPGQADVDVVELAKDATTAGVENIWHADLTWHTTPSWGAVLRAVEVPALGGATLWADMAAAYDTLPAELQERIEHLTAVHDWRHNFGLAMPAADVAALSPQFPAAEHPVVRVHPDTGRRTLFVNPIFTSHIVGLSEDESDALLSRLFRQATIPELQCLHRWQAGDVAFWDNRATQHYAVSDYYPERRVMQRISVQGDRPFGPARTEAAGRTLSA